MCTVAESYKKNFIKFLSPLSFKTYFLFLSFSLSGFSSFFRFPSHFFFSPSSTLCFAKNCWVSQLWSWSNRETYSSRFSLVRQRNIDYTIKVQKTKCDNDDHDESAIWSIVLERREPKPQMETRPLEEMIFSKLDCRQVLHSVSIKELGGDDRRTWRSKIEIVARDWFGEESEVGEWGWVSWVSGDVAVSGGARNLYLEGLNIKLDNWLFLCIYWLYSY